MKQIFKFCVIICVFVYSSLQATTLIECGGRGWSDFLVIKTNCEVPNGHNEIGKNTELKGNTTIDASWYNFKATKSKGIADCSSIYTKDVEERLYDFDSIKTYRYYSIDFSLEDVKFTFTHRIQYYPKTEMQLLREYRYNVTITNNKSGKSSRYKRGECNVYNLDTY